MDPTTALHFDALGADGAVIAQLTLPTGLTAHAVFNAQGKSTSGQAHDWEESGMELTFFGESAGLLCQLLLSRHRLRRRWLH